MPPLLHLEPGTRFLQPDLGLTGTLVRVNECSAMVRVDGQERVVEFVGQDGHPREFKCNRTSLVAWSPYVWVKPLGTARHHQPRQNGEAAMATKTKTKTTPKKAATKKTAPAKAKKAAPTKAAKAAAAEKKLSALDAAAKLLADLNQPLNAKEMIETMAARGLWSSPGGKTPEATLYAAIIREIAKKGKDARFKKHDRGQFVANTSTAAAPKAAGKKPATKKAATKKAASKKTAPADGTPGPKAVSELFKI